jgi:hypothetical protein
MFFSLLSISLAQADSVQARCDIYPKGEDHTDVVIPCVFSQRQGYISINRSDNVFHDLTPRMMQSDILRMLMARMFIDKMVWVKVE